MERSRQHGLSLIEAIVILAIVATLAAMIAPGYGTVKRQAQVTQCVAQLNEVAAAIQQYRQDNRGKSPLLLWKLVPRYLDKEKLICPFVKHMAPDFVAMIAQRKLVHPWSSYFYFSQKGLDTLQQRGETAFSFSEALTKRGSDTPLVMCRNHRESFSLYRIVARQDKPWWYFPQDPVIVLRWGGNVTTTKKGGALTDHTTVGAEQDLLTL